MSDTPFPRIPYAEAMLRYGTDKPDLRNPLEIVDITEIFETSTFAPFKNKTVRAINVPNCASKPKAFRKYAEICNRRTRNDGAWLHQSN